MSGNWANFGDFSSAAGAKQTSSGGTDDGWADFGGFEAAAPAPTSQQSQATTPSSTPSWTAFGQQSAGPIPKTISKQQQEEIIRQQQQQQLLLQKQQALQQNQRNLLQRQQQQMQRKDTGHQSPQPGALPPPSVSPNKARRPLSHAGQPTPTSPHIPQPNMPPVGSGQIGAQPVTLRQTAKPAMHQQVGRRETFIEDPFKEKTPPTPSSIDMTSQGANFFSEFGSVPMNAPPLDQSSADNFGDFSDPFADRQTSVPVATAVSEAPVALATQAQVTAIPQQQNVVDTAKLQEANKKTEEAERKLSLIEQEKLRIQKDHEALVRKHEVLAKQLGEQEQQVSEQKQKYEELQRNHAEELEKLRLAGHEALSMIVEEYKELCRTAVLEEHEKAELKLQDALKQEALKCETLLQQQQQRLSDILKQEQEENEQKMKETIDSLTEESKMALQAVLEEERIRSQEAIERAVKAWTVT
jgi:hypothetical protein